MRQDVEQRLAGAARGRPGLLALWRLDGAATMLAADYFQHAIFSV